MQSGQEGDQAEDYAGKIGDKDRPILVLLQEGVAAPKGAVDAGYQGLDWIAVLSVQIVDNLWKIRDIHQHQQS